MSGVLQSQGSTLVLIDYSVDKSKNEISAKMSYFESGLSKITEVTDLSTGESYNLLVPEDAISIGTYAVDLERTYELD